MKAISTRVLSLALLTILIVGIIVFSFFVNQNPIGQLDDMGEVSDFTLSTYEGENFTLSDTNGQIRILTFIYTECDTGCSLITLKMSELRDKLIEEGLYDEVQMVTIDFDYMHDTEEDLSTYVRNFIIPGDSWKFLLGNQDEIRNVTNAYNFSFELVQSPHMNNTSDGNDTDSEGMDHSEHADHSVVYSHPFAVYFIDADLHLRSLRGIDFTIQDAYYTVDFLLSE